MTFIMNIQQPSSFPLKCMSQDKKIIIAVLIEYTEVWYTDPEVSPAQNKGCHTIN